MGRRIGVEWWLPAVLLLAGVGQVRAQSDVAEERLYTVALVGVPLADALEQLIDQTRIGMVYESDVVAGRTTFCRAERAGVDALLACVLRGTGLDYVRLSSGAYVLVPDPRTRPRFGSLTGRVLDGETGRPLPDASVLLAREGTGAATNRDGRFAFAALRPGPHAFVVTHAAYHAAADTVWVRPDRPVRVDVVLRPRVVLSAPVVVSGFEMRLPSEGLGVVQRTADDRTAAPGVVAGDVVRDLDAVVGVRLGDALADVHVQGGAANEQHFLLDGAPVFVPVSVGGFIGPFSPFAVEQVTVQKAGFGASHGSGLSGVIEMEHHLEAPAPALDVQVDPLGLNGRWLGRAGNPSGYGAAWMVAGRKGLWEYVRPGRLEDLFRSWATEDRFLFEALAPPGEAPACDAEACAVEEERASGPVDVGFNDLHAAARIHLGGLRSLRVSFYRGANTFGIDEDASPEVAEAAGVDELDDAYRWSNRMLQGRYEWVQSRRLFLHARAWTGAYRLVHPVILNRVGAPPDANASDDDRNEVLQHGFRIGGDYAASARHFLSGAVEATLADSDFELSLDPFGAAPATPELVGLIPWRLALFLEDRVALGHRAVLNLGSRLTYLPLRHTVLAEPRVSLQVDREAGRLGAWAVRAAAGVYRQYLHSFDVATYNVTALLPRMRFWLPVGRHQRPPEAIHTTLAFLYRPDEAWQLGLETYYKHQPHLLVLDYGRRLEIDAPGDVLTGADGHAYGLALTVRRTARRARLDAQYEYAVARRRVANRFGGAFVPVPWDAPHRLYAALDLMPLPHLTATVRWQGVYGRSWGFRQAYYDYLEPDPALSQVGGFDFSDPAAHRLPAFSQLDVGLAYARQIAGVGTQARVSVVNLLDRRNVIDWNLETDEATGAYTRRSRHAVPLVPSFSLRLSL